MAVGTNKGISILEEDRAIPGLELISLYGTYQSLSTHAKRTARNGCPTLHALFVAEGDERIDAGGGAGWDPAGYDSGDGEGRGHGGSRGRVATRKRPSLRVD